MNATLSPPRPSTPPHIRLLTIADVAALPSSLPTGDVRYELDYGRLVVMSPPGGIHGLGQSGFVFELRGQGQQRGHGKAFGEVGVVLQRDPDRLVGPDAAFISKRRLPFRLSTEGYLETIPELVVEVRSKNDDWPEILAKVKEYLDAGVVVVWVADPAKRIVTEFRTDQEQREWGPTDTLTVPDVISGFEVVVDTLFG